MKHACDIETERCVCLKSEFSSLNFDIDIGSSNITASSLENIFLLILSVTSHHQLRSYEDGMSV